MPRPAADPPPTARGAVHRGATVLLVLGVVVTVTAVASTLLDGAPVASQQITEPVTIAGTLADADADIDVGVDADARVDVGAGTEVPQLEAPLDTSDSPGLGQVTQPSSSGLTDADRTAGLRSRTVRRSAGTRLAVVPGRVPAPGPGTRYRVQVLVESGLDVDRAAFAAFVLGTLNDPRGWGRGGRSSFARVDSSGADRPDIKVVLASPATSAAMCRPLVTRGTLSCAKGSTAILTMYRWVNGTTDYGGDRTGYRRYLVNHEVGHTLGQGHVSCPRPGALAPVMMQQTKGLRGCRPNSWPYP